MAESNEEQAYQFYRRASLLKSEGEFSAAAPLYQEAITLMPDMPGGGRRTLRNSYAECLMKAGRIDQAYDYWHDNVMHPASETRYTYTSPLSDIKALHEYAVVAEHARHPEEVIWARRQMIFGLVVVNGTDGTNDGNSIGESHLPVSDGDLDALTPAQREALAETAAGCDCALHRDYDGSLTHLRRALFLDPHQAWAYYYMGMAFKRRGENAQALAAFRKAAATGSGAVCVKAQRFMQAMDL